MVFLFISLRIAGFLELLEVFIYFFVYGFGLIVVVLFLGRVRCRSFLTICLRLF